MPGNTLLKALTEAGLGSRRKMADAIKNGRVSVNGAVAENFRQPANLHTDRISLDGRPLKLEAEQVVYLMLNKPGGLLCTTSDERGRNTVLGILPEKYRRLRLYPVGRLDMDSTGLLILTNDGSLTYQLTHPKFEHEKEYLVQIEGALTSQEKQRLERGVKLEDGITAPALVKELRNSSPYNYSITIHEGKKRQVRRMFANLGYRVVALKRVRMGNLMLGNLEEGATRQLTVREIKALLNG
ncbi:MAG: rRNA pseudouridine synthase [Dehalococcoidales bacterium]|nr:rRNA pseudouridine synthase [Dehalococcoidales bacterium]